MTTPPPAPGQPSGPTGNDRPTYVPQAGPPMPSYGVPVRPLTAWALLLLAGAILAFEFLSWIFPPFSGDFLDRFSLDRFTALQVMVAPLLAMLLATRVGPALPAARLMGMVAVTEYAAAVVLGTLVFLITIATRFDHLGDGIYAFGGLLAGLGGLAIDGLLLGLLALAGLWTYQIYLRLGGTLPKINIHTN
jgi:hypothetical protein